MTAATRVPAGCSLAIVAINTIAMASLASSFATGPYSSWLQEAWYRYGSLGFLFGGAVLPGIGIITIGRHRYWLSVTLTLWMVVALFLCAGYAFQSGGGI